MIFVFSYDRPDMLMQTLKDISNSSERIIVIDDGSEYDYIEHQKYCAEYIRLPHEGKAGWYKHWQVAMKMAEESPDWFFAFMPDDFTGFDVGRAIDLCRQYHPLSCFNIINCGRQTNWGGKSIPFDHQLIHCGFNDCGFFCRRSTLEKIGFQIQKPRKKLNSSGVGYELTMMMRQADISMFMPVRSLAHHGAHESKMHPEERKINPLISR
jgi:glycosyltransferase involved in cell wall biosynthesis